jgi:antitoxin MazE
VTSNGCGRPQAADRRAPRSTIHSARAVDESARGASRIGNSLGVILDRPVLELLQIDENTPLEITTDGDVLMLRPVRGDKKHRVRASAAKMVKAHAKTLAKLAK